jgi:hypothetical protein
MTPAAGVDLERWVVDSVIAGTGVAAIVPLSDRFEAYGRILYPFPDDQRWDDMAPFFLGTTRVSQVSTPTRTTSPASSN